MIAAGFQALDFELKSGLRPDFSLPRVRELLFLAARSLGLCLGAVMGTPCRSFSEAADRPCLRPIGDPMGMEDPPPEWRAYIARENVLIVFSGEFCLCLHEIEVEWLVENPAYTGDPSSPVHRKGRAHAAALFVTPIFKRLEEVSSALIHVFPQCSLGAPWRKLTGIMASLRLGVRLMWMRGLLVPPYGCGCRRHRAVAYGVDAQGRSRSKLSARWPRPMVGAFVEGYLSLQSHALPPAAQGEGGRVSDGPRLHPFVAAACQAARSELPRFSTFGSLPAASDLELDGSPMPVMPSMSSPAVVTSLAGDGLDSGSDTASETSLEEWADAPPGPLHISSIPKPGSWRRMLLWWDKAQVCMQAWSDGLPGVDPGECRVTQRQIKRFARGRRYDARIPANTVELQASTRNTGEEEYPGPRILDRAKWRSTATKHGWGIVDPDIMSQAGEGGCESRSDRPLVTRLVLHHRGLVDNFEVAMTAVEAEFADGVARAFEGMLPFWPTGCLQRNVVWADRTKLVDGQVVSYSKSRMTIDPSEGEDALNDTIDAEDRRVAYPALRQFTRGAAIVDAAVRPAGLSVVVYTCDVQAAFPHLILQRLDFVDHCFVWYCRRRGCLITAYIVRVVFGGAYSPQRFCRVMAPVDVEIEHQILAFDKAHPAPDSILAWELRRRQMQEAGELPQGDAQASASHRQRFADDVHGSGSSQVLPCPPHLLIYDVGAEATLMIGGQPSHPFCRAAIHCRIVLHVWAQHGLTGALEKTTCGDVAQPLGARVTVATKRIDCPPLKGSVMRLQLSEVGAELEAGGSLDAARVATVTGRLTNISQYEPSLLGFLHGGYTVVGAALRKGRGGVGGRRFRMAAVVKLVPGRRAFRELAKLVSHATSVVEANVGVPWASPVHFRPLGSRGVVASSTDASQALLDDGVGGFLFHPAFPKVIWLASEAWPVDVKAALVSAARPRWQKLAAPSEANLSMPAAEVFGCGALPAAVDAITRSSGVRQWASSLDHVGQRVVCLGSVELPSPVEAVYAIGDCRPAASAINKGSSSVPQMRILVMHHRKLTEQWLGVQVPRLFNLDADRLSHPSMLGDVIRDILAAGYEPRVVPFLESSWAVLRRAMLASSDECL
jgi:hypothetical protein